MAEQNYVEGQEFIGTYPPEAAIWCNNNGYHIEEIGAQEGQRVFKIVKNEIHIPTKQEILAQKEQEYGMNRWQREGILAEHSEYSDFAKSRAQELEDLAEEIRQEQELENLNEEEIEEEQAEPESEEE